MRITGQKLTKHIARMEVVLQILTISWLLVQDHEAAFHYKSLQILTISWSFPKKMKVPVLFKVVQMITISWLLLQNHEAAFPL